MVIAENPPVMVGQVDTNIVCDQVHSGVRSQSVHFAFVRIRIESIAHMNTTRS